MNSDLCSASVLPSRLQEECLTEPRRLGFVKNDVPASHSGTWVVCCPESSPLYKGALYQGSEVRFTCAPRWGPGQSHLGHAGPHIWVWGYLEGLTLAPQPGALPVQSPPPLNQIAQGHSQRSDPSHRAAELGPLHDLVPLATLGFVWLDDARQDEAKGKPARPTQQALGERAATAQWLNYPCWFPGMRV